MFASASTDLNEVFDNLLRAVSLLLSIQVSSARQTMFLMLTSASAISCHESHAVRATFTRVDLLMPSNSDQADQTLTVRFSVPVAEQHAYTCPTAR